MISFKIFSSHETKKIFFVHYKPLDIFLQLLDGALCLCTMTLQLLDVLFSQFQFVLRVTQVVIFQAQLLFNVSQLFL